MGDGKCTEEDMLPLGRIAIQSYETDAISGYG